MTRFSGSQLRLGGVTEVARELGVSRQRVSQIRRTPGFPPPIGEIAAGPIWDLDSIGRWNESGLRRSTGRPSSQDSRVLGDRYVLEDPPIGSGGFADVYRAADITRDGQHRFSVVAIKILRNLSDDEVRRRFLRELRLISECSHPSVVPILDSGEDENGHLWYAMPLAKGSLADEVDRFVGNDESIVAIMRQTCDALSYVHGLGIFHRDLKPGNILRVGARTWALADFGLAREAERRSTALTSTLQGVGTPFFAAPETWRGAKYAEAPADVFSIGKVLQHLVTGELPVDGDWKLGRFRAAITKATRPKPADRYSSAAEFLSAIEAAAAAPARWESPAETTTDLGDRLRAAAGDEAAVQELMAAFEAQSPRESVEQLDHAVPLMSGEAIRIAWMQHNDPFARLLEAFSDHAAATGFDFDFCDTIADFWECVLLISKDEHITYLAVKCLLPLGRRHNRWHVRDVAIGVLQRVREAAQALACSEAIREVDPAALEWALESFVVRSLHPTIREEVAAVLGAGAPS